MYPTALGCIGACEVQCLRLVVSDGATSQYQAWLEYQQYRPQQHTHTEPYPDVTATIVPVKLIQAAPHRKAKPGGNQKRQGKVNPQGSHMWAIIR